MGFELTKLIGGLLMPLSIGLAVVGAGLVLAGAFRPARTGFVITGIGFAWLLLLALPPVSERALESLESTYPILTEPPEVAWIVVLGGGSRGGADRPPAGRLGESSLYRLAEGVRLAHSLPDARLVTSGGAGGSEPSTAALMAEVATQWGIEAERVVSQGEPRTTAEEARAMARRMVPGERVILVTSAVHMRRAVALFEGQGVSVIPAPAGHLVDPDRPERHVGHQLPQAKYLDFAERALWERIGLLWAWLRGEAAR